CAHSSHLFSLSSGVGRAVRTKSCPRSRSTAVSCLSAREVNRKSPHTTLPDARGRCNAERLIGGSVSSQRIVTDACACDQSSLSSPRRQAAPERARDAGLERPIGSRAG